ncbi:phosphatase PAP2 family protein [Streptoalloteichus tenebrarius]|uniref:phosphatase PAP2 family protein n=1 Tax=Streptoalloteichus tenebrarius (strain ATCC 17920 / DSM 40477 / JCM 4838 / CBS 697.72 / NBRC 16177 / NCIMB 11028 / NRRL B-12390 / A12253. 1 / ISP 5477) TaxID=1933 RepID=UPI0020A5C3A3|nr:phosphatase PAP2 family protein [Streptoalloteichus tenebrarius]
MLVETAPVRGLGAQPLAVRAVWGAVAGAAAAVCGYLVSVWTGAGQRLENLPLVGPVSPPVGTRVAALHAMEGLTVLTLGLAVGLALTIGVLRGRMALGVASASVVVGSAVAAEALRLVLDRPHLDPAAGRAWDDNSLPSGQAAVATAICCALTMVVPQRHRVATALVTSCWAAGVGVQTVGSRWHRPGDVLVGDLLALTLACGVVLLLLARRPSARVELSRRERVVWNSVALAPLGLLALGALVLGTGLGVAALEVLGDHQTPPSSAVTLALAAGHSVAVAGAALVGFGFLLVVEGLELDVPTKRGATGWGAADRVEPNWPTAQEHDDIPGILSREP